MNEQGRLRVRGLDDLEPVLAAVEDHKIPVPLATRLAVDQLARAQPSWSAFELTEALTGLLARTSAETEVIRRVVQVGIKVLAEAKTPAPRPSSHSDSPSRPPASSMPSEPPPGAAPHEAFGAPSAVGMLDGNGPVILLALAILVVTGFVSIYPGGPPPDDVPYPPGPCPPPEVKAACPSRALVARGAYIRMVGAPPERDYAERPAAVVASIALLLLAGLTGRAWWAGRNRPPKKPPSAVDGMDAVALDAPPWPPLFTADERVRLSWGAGRTLTEEDEPVLDVPATVAATVAQAGLFSPRQQRARRERAVWVLDDVGDGAMLRAPLIDQLVAEFVAVGVPHRRWRVRDDVLVDTVGGESITWDELEDLAQAASVVMVSSGTAWLVDGGVRPEVEPRLAALATLRRFAWVDPDDGALAAAFADRSVTVISPAALPKWLSSGAVVSTPEVPAATVDLWAGVLLRYGCVPAATPPVAAQLAEDLRLPVRALDLPTVWRRSSGRSFVVAPKVAVQLRRRARKQHPALWVRAGDEYRARYTAFARSRRGKKGWSGSRAETHVKAMLALMTVEDACMPGMAVDEAVLVDAVDTLHGAPTVHASVKWHVRAHGGADDRRRWPARARRLLGVIDGSIPPDPSPASGLMKNAWALSAGALVAASLAYEAIASRPLPPSTQVPVEFVNIPGGRGCLGSPACQRPTLEELEKSGLSKFTHELINESEGIRTVRLSPFALARTETTRQAFEAWRRGRPDLAREPPPSPATHPVVEVTWGEARAFCQSLGEGHDLPTEAQWAYAARAGAMSRYPFGDDPVLLDAHAWYSKNSGGNTHPVGAKQASRLGLHDLLGNVWEWALDAYQKRPSDLLGEPTSDPCVGCNQSDRPVGALRVLRGGSFSDSAVELRAADRLWNLPGYRNLFIGFRCAGPFLPSSDP